ncbi:helix-turn-helix domain-containing protein [Primorskyibacter sp. S87]|uniref:helix-turn-helix domain-containing protein n=1 Tax=Primorskyibacter sp. S87 TaxID=3415126 RepID=UPI003C7C3F9D
MSNEPTYLTTEELADRWNVTANMLAAMRHRGEGPPYRKFSRLVRYDLEDVMSYEDEVKRYSTITPKGSAA